MGTTREDIREWFQRGKKEGNTHMLVVCDSFDHEDYPVFMKGTAADARHRGLCLGEMQRLMEVYHLGSDMETQLAEHRAFNYEAFELSKGKKLTVDRAKFLKRSETVEHAEEQPSTYVRYLRDAEKSLCAAIGARPDSFDPILTNLLKKVRGIITREK